MEAREATATGESCMRVDAIAKVTGQQAKMLINSPSAFWLAALRRQVT